MAKPIELIETVVDCDIPLAGAIKASLAEAQNLAGKLNRDVLGMPGMSGRKFRFLLNNLVGRIADPRYLEIGCWHGSTFCAALHGNKVMALAIDNWSQFGGPSAEFFANLSRNCSRKTSVSVLTADFRSVNYATVGRYNIYFFDGPHAAQDHYDALAVTLPALDDTFVFIVDDWNWEQVRRGTFEALSRLRLHVAYQMTIRTSLDGTVPNIQRGDSDWHNGYFLSVLAQCPSAQRIVSGMPSGV